MKRKSRLAVSRVHVETQGSVLKQALTTSWDDGDPIAVEASTDHSLRGGTALIGSEQVTYSGVLVSASDDPAAPDYLLGVQRPAPQSHPVGTFIQEGLTPTVVKLVDGYPDGEDVTIPGLPMSSVAWPLLRLGDYDRDAAPVVPMEIDENGETMILDGPIGAVPVFDEDLQVLPEAGIKIWANEEIAQTVQPIGLGDGAAPSVPGAAPVITQGPNMHLIDMRAYAKPDDWLAFVIEYSTNGGGSWTSLGDSGSNVFVHSNLTLGTNYRYRFSVRDSEGNLTSPSPASIDYTARGVGTADLVLGSVTADILASIITISNTFQTAGSGSRVMFDGSGIRLINSGGVTVADLNAATGIATLVGAVYKTNASGSRVEIDSNGLRFYDSGDALKVELKTSDSSATFAGAITSGSTISGATLTGGTVRTSATGARVELTSGRASEVVFYDTATERASLSGVLSSGNKLKITGAGLWATGASQFDAAVDILANLAANGILIGTNTGDPPSGFVRLYKDVNNLMGKAPGRAAVVVAAL